MLTSSKQIEPHDEFEWNCKLRWNVDGERSIYLTPPRLKFHHGSSKEPFQWTFSKFLITQYRDTNISRPFTPVWPKMIEILIPFQNLCLWIGEAHNWEWINWGLVQTAINQIWLGEKSENMKVFTTNHQHQDCYKYLRNCYKISSRYLKNIIKILKKCHQDFYKISCRYLQNIIKIFYKISPR